MSHEGDCYDDAVMESFFGTLKRELVHRETYATREEARRSLFEYIEVFYNRRRLHSTLGLPVTRPVRRESETSPSQRPLNVGKVRRPAPAVSRWVRSALPAPGRPPRAPRWVRSAPGVGWH